MSEISPRSLQRRVFLGTAFAGVLGMGVAGQARAQATTGGAAQIERLNAALLTAMKGGQSTPFAQRFQMIAAVIDQSFDLPVIFQRSVGPHWAAMSADEQAELLSAFRRYTVANFVANFDTYDGQKFQIDPGTRSVGQDQQVVTTRFGAPGQPPQTLAYVMHETPSSWRVVDVLADGSISRVAVQRSDFRTLLSHGGGQALLASLQKKVADLSDGALV
jgi:phospholipid transport system substrate-binding protein